jgi:glycine dehydrogenase subunit 2
VKRRAIRDEALFFERNPRRVRRQGYLLPALDVPDVEASVVLPSELVREPDPHFPDLTEMEVVQHFHRLSQLNYAVDEGLYPLGSCTMKYNPRLNEQTARLPGLASLHPLQPRAP